MSKNLYLTWNPGAKGDFLSACIWLLYNYDSSMNVDSVYKIQNDFGKVFFGKNNMGQLPRNPAHAFEVVQPFIDIWQDIFNNMQYFDSDWDREKEFKELMEYCYTNNLDGDFGKNIKIYGSHTLLSEFVYDKLDYFIPLMKDKFNITDWLMIDTPDVETISECIILHLLKDTDNTIETLRVNKSNFVLNIISQVKRTRIVKDYIKEDLKTIPYEVVSNAGSVELMNEIENLFGKSNNTDEYHKFVSDYREIHLNNDANIKCLANEFSDEVHDTISRFNYGLNRIVKNEKYWNKINGV